MKQGFALHNPTIDLPACPIGGRVKCRPGRRCSGWLGCALWVRGAWLAMDVRFFGVRADWRKMGRP
ncbi:MAG: hypothetical protein FIA98_15075 [Anaerolineae bacterium]|nr:hypothetical protein [Anaerolineae bacterium]